MAAGEVWTWALRVRWGFLRRCVLTSNLVGASEVLFPKHCTGLARSFMVFMAVDAHSSMG